jgi:hypothetical protein
MNKEAKVHMLPTEDGVIFKNRATGTLVTSIPNVAKKLYPAQHLYITTDEEIKEGDWFIWLKYNFIEKATKKDNNKDCRKIIATTDPKLLKPQIKQVNWIGSERIWSLPQIPQSFIEEYCKAGGIDKVLVEYEDANYGALFTLKDGSTETVVAQKLKVDPIHNTITTHRIVEKMYSKEEMLTLCKEAFSCGVRLWEEWEEEDHEMWDKFVKENL